LDSLRNTAGLVLIGLAVVNFSPQNQYLMYDKSQTVIKKIPFTTHKMRVFKTAASDLAVGQKVIYFEVMGENGPKSDPFETTIKSACYEICGSTLVNVEGKKGGVDIAHIQLKEVSNV
jgi:hypothetical protein